jgi:D-3-phosphoglycerate dehydrogenase
VTQSGHASLSKLEQAGYTVVLSPAGRFPTEGELTQLLPDCVGLLAGVEPVTAKVLESAQFLRVISRNGSGLDNIDLDAAKKLNIKVCRAEGANARGVAELTIALILSLTRAIPATDARLKQGEWKRKNGIELQGRTLGLVGCGRIGQEVARLALAFDMRVLAYDPVQTGLFSPSLLFRYGSLDDVLSQSDIVSLHCPPLSDGRPLVCADTIRKMKRGVYIINTARGTLLQEDDVLEAIKRGHIAGLAADAFRAEPPEELELFRHENVIATPHIGGFTKESVDRAMESAVDNLLANL